MDKNSFEDIMSSIPFGWVEGIGLRGGRRFW